MDVRISIVGLGYIGSTVMGCIADRGVEVIGVDVDPERVEMINNGIPPITERGLNELFQKNKSKIKATTEYEEILNTDITFICVGTPSNPDGSVNLSYVKDATKKIGKILKKKEGYHLVVLRSTVPPGTSREVITIIEAESGKKCGKDFGYCMNPEFLREGKAIEDFFNPPFTIIGEFDEKSGSILEDFYKKIGVNNHGNIYRMKLESAEIFKYINNAFHAIKVAFANEVARLCDQFNVDSRYLMEIFVKDTILNISSYYLRPGYAFGGSCLPKDVKGILSFSKVSVPVIRATLASNQEHIKWSLEKILEENPRKICIVGISFKKGTEDTRESPYIALMRMLHENGVHVCYYDPLASTPEFQKVETPTELYQEDIDILIIGSGNGVEQLDLAKFKRIIDLQGEYKEKYKALKTYKSLI